MYKKILQWPSPLLRKKAKDVSHDEIASLEFQSHLHDLMDTCDVALGLGLASNQIGMAYNAFVIRPQGLDFDNPDPSEYKSQFMVCINPVFKPSLEKVKWKEACLSLTGLEMNVKRHKSGTLEYISERGEQKSVDLKWPLSGAVQHELDHLSGKTIAHVDRKRSAASITLSLWRKKKMKHSLKLKREK